jgi:hypothetical protein
LLGAQHQGAVHYESLTRLQAGKDDRAILEAEPYFDRALLIVIVTRVHIYPVGFILDKQGVQRNDDR